MHKQSASIKIPGSGPLSGSGSPLSVYPLITSLFSSGCGSNVLPLHAGTNTNKTKLHFVQYINYW